MINILVVTHGNFGNELIKSAEMIAGKQENIEALGLFVEDDFDMFKSKVKNKIKELENEEGVLVLTDMFGGTPSNASFANLNNLDFECVTGLNLPMMLEVLINRDIKTLKELVNIAVDVKKNSIFNLREIVLEKWWKGETKMEIGLIRVDSRLIHGQVITKWLNYSKANVIVVVDDELSKDSFMSEIYKASAPNGIIVEILSIDDFMKNTGTHKYSNKRLLILLKNIETVYELYLRQFKMEHIQLGGLPSGVGKKAIYKAIFLNEEEINKLRDIANSGVYIDMQVIPEDTKSDLMKMIK